MKTNTFWAVCFVVAFGPVLAASAQENLAELRLESLLQNKLDQIVADEGFPGATLAVVFNGVSGQVTLDGEPLPEAIVQFIPEGDKKRIASGRTDNDGKYRIESFRKTINLASGFEEPDTKQKMAPGSRMFCGSTGKTFVSAVALQLVSEGKFQLDDLANKYFDSETDREWFAKLPNSKSITIRSLMNHTSGLPRYLFQERYLDDLKKNPLKSRSPREGLSALHGAEPMHEVGKGWGYSDSNYLVLGLIIEKVTGKTYYENAQERLLDPLKLTHTLPATQPKLAGLTQGHIGSVNMFDLPEKTVADGKYVMNPEFEWCGGGFVTNVGDLAKWLAAIHSGKVLDESTYSKLIAPVDFRTGQPGEQGYGLGTFVWQTDNGPFFGHAGIMPGYLTQIEYSQKYKFAIALQTNTDQSMGRRLHQHVQALAELVIKKTN